MLLIPALLLASCGQNTEKIKAIDLDDLDTTVTAAEDFYRFANGGWQARHPLSAEYARYGSFEVLAEDNQQKLKDLFAAMAELKAEKGSVEQKIADLYRQGLDSVTLNKEGTAPIAKYIREIYSARDKAELVKTIAAIHSCGGSGFFDSGVESDLENSDSQILFLSQGGLGIGDRDYYCKEDQEAVRESYKAMLRKLFSLTGIQNPDYAAENAYSLEASLAEASWTRVQNRDIAAMLNPMSSKQICAAYPGFDFASYFTERGIEPQDRIIVCQPSFFEAFSRIYSGAQLSQIKDYLAGLLISDAASLLSDECYAASFDFYSRTLSGVTEQKPRWKRALGVPNSILSEAVGEIYTAKYFPESSKKKVLDIVDNLQEALGQHIDALEWMGDETKAYAREKLASFTVKIGYPDQWKDYSTLVIDPEKSYFDNVREARIWMVKDNMSKLGKATDRSEWGMSPQTVNAYYNPTTNEICFPAAILQPPFFNPDADDAVNYGAIGVVIGHEMTHGFDDQGRLFDKSGNMTSWWTDADDKAFREKTSGLVEQFNAIEVLPGLFANGQLSLGENIADQGGLRIAYTALQNKLAGSEPDPIDGFTAAQRFYLGYAHVWANNITDTEKQRRTLMDEHSLAENRVNASLKNIDSFFEAFGIKEGDAMYRPENERVIIW